MGGTRSGRHATRVPAEDRYRLDVRILHRQGAFVKPLVGYYSGVLRYDRGGKEIGSIGWEVHHRENAIALEVRYNAGRAGEVLQPVAITVGVEFTPCRYGGERPWFRCPRCDRRCGVLYLVDTLFACRMCGRICYRSQQNSPSERARARRDKLRDSLGVPSGIWPTPLPWKPRWMRWRTFSRLALALRVADEEFDRMFGVRSLPALNRLSAMFSRVRKGRTGKGMKR